MGAFLRKYERTGIIADLPRKGREAKLKPNHFNFIDRQMEENNELSSLELRDMLRAQFGVKVSRRAVQRVWRKLG